MSAPTPPSPAPRRRRRLDRIAAMTVALVQQHLAEAFGVDPEHRIGTVATMLENNARRAPGYWLQLFLAVGIATLGLALDSTAVVIGGMLVSPLMGPIVELGMGFAVGSSLLVLRAFLRVLLSAVGVVAAAAGITLAFPFHEVTGEITARTVPTLLDLLVAVFCALAAAYTAVRQTADTTAAAAGTAIGIALVPPLCVIGIGLGTASGPVASGAALLFIANFSAILVVAVASFLLLGYNQVDATAIEHAYLEHDHNRTERLAARVHAALRELFGSRYGLAMRLLVPGVFLLAVYVPLRRALDEVTWQVRVREAIRRILAAESPQTMQSALTVDRGTVTLRLVTVGTPTHAAELERRLETNIAAAAGIAPAVTVTAVADAKLLGAAAAREQRPAIEESPAFALDALRSRVGTTLASRWPGVAGPLLGWGVSLGSDGGVTVTVRHLGPPLGDTGGALIADLLREPIGRLPRLVDVALPGEPITADPAAWKRWTGTVQPLLDRIVPSDSLQACVLSPRRSRHLDTVRAALAATAAGRAGIVHYDTAATWSLELGRRRCARPEGPAADTLQTRAPSTS